MQTVSEQSAVAHAAAIVVSAQSDTFADRIFQTFTAPESTKIECLKDIVKAGTTVGQFKEQCDKASKLAAEFDILNGWVVPVDGATAKPVKGRAAYGPKQSSLASRLSEARQVYGGLRLAFDAFENLGYSEACDKARRLLKDAGLNWDGTSAKDETIRAAERQVKVDKAARKQAEEENPQQAGETIEQYYQRLAVAATENVAEQQAAAWGADVKANAGRIIEKHGSKMADDIALEVLRQGTPSQILIYMQILQGFYADACNKPQTVALM